MTTVTWHPMTQTRLSSQNATAAAAATLSESTPRRIGMCAGEEPHFILPDLPYPDKTNKLSIQKRKTRIGGRVGAMLVEEAPSVGG